MRVSSTLSFYIGRRFLMSVMGLYFSFLALIFVFDMIELLRRAASKPNISFTLILEMAFLKLPHMGQEALPFAVLLGGMMAFWRLTRNHELVIARSSGVSAWQFLFPVLGMAALLGVLQVTVFNPVSSMTLARFVQIETAVLKGQQSALAISKTGLWLRQANEQGQSVVHAVRVHQAQTSVELQDVSIIVYRDTDQFGNRIEADRATLEDGFWHLYDVWSYLPEHPPQHAEELLFATDLTLNRIQDSFAPPETMSFWELPKFIDTLEASGFSALRHRLHLHALLAAPLLLCAMVLIAAMFTLRLSNRRGGATRIVVGGVLSGFTVYVFTDVVFALGLSDRIPAVLAAWTPSGVTTLLGLAMLLHLEDG
ncbi:LPS export ABC transporter permease LptG [Magnetospira sp. QH-2]|uniref:LPS export ABC transporter permease LptG n=1 Tax=Magnetospira sp. (strain QH-2) TaxID=1288970 RepID=UPI0003E81453|nr:LPS export ABC transporter permease LptG [Magnetospira sp. QH-2]CCQ74411.1 putative permease lptG [Magnetospira sp. QH-2]